MNITVLKSTNHLKQQKPLVLCLTNSVTKEFVANCLLSLGAAPLMSESPEEIEELVAISQALYLNIGTLDHHFMALAKQAALLANQTKIPVILDPVGAGASRLRTTSALELAKYAQVIRGNASEIMALSGNNGSPAGVENTQSVSDAQSSAQTLARQFSASVVISGPCDFVTDGREHTTCHEGHALMQRVTGMGCSFTAVIAAFCACSDDYYQASQNASDYFSLAGLQAASKTNMPGSFRTAFIDALYHNPLLTGF